MSQKIFKNFRNSWMLQNWPVCWEIKDWKNQWSARKIWARKIGKCKIHPIQRTPKKIQWKRKKKTRTWVNMSFDIWKKIDFYAFKFIKINIIVINEFYKPLWFDQILFHLRLEFWLESLKKEKKFSKVIHIFSESFLNGHVIIFCGLDKIDENLMHAE